ncbi:type II toxin-antitoxin system HicA family toxin [Patescibacteria group bacterium]|nr:type II toxin-antitoxin system HicA family toxin [Patescibacteria group bacterium]MBU4512649.1 type II toxin-antitoxin system HicA family toxin [Patescibacteria group bacterium]MCG2693555.1 type II toxin-antitoxin system HicA family toxin [Candidatus Parcubacteria bacterium]
MPHFPALTYFQVLKKIKKRGFIFHRQARGSHELWIREFDKKVIVIAKHPGRTIKRKTLKNIIKATGLSVEEFRKL